MKIAQTKNYKKPLYAIGIAAALAAVSVTGCTDDPFKVKYSGDVAIATTETEDVRLAGEVADTDPTEVGLDGGVDMPQETKPTVNSLITAGIVQASIDPND